jgi:hypothetical protein
MLHVLSRLPRKLQDPHLVHTASRTRLLIFRPHHASRLRHHPAPLALPQPRGAPRLLVVQIAPALLRLCRASGRAVSLLDFSSFGRTRIYCAYAMHLDAPSHCSTSRRSPRAGSSSTTSPPSRVRVPRHVARLVMRLVTLLVVDYSASHRLVVDHFASVARPGASARRAAHHVARRRLLHLAQARRRLLRLAQACHRQLRLAQARRRLLCLHRASGCLGTSRGSSSTTSPTPRIWVPRHVVRLIVCRRLLRLRHATGCLGSSRGSSHGSLRRLSSTASLTPRIRVPRHVARPVTRLIVDYFVRRDFVLRPRWLYFSHAVHGDYLSRGNTGSTSSMLRTSTTSSSGRITSTIHLN